MNDTTNDDRTNETARERTFVLSRDFPASRERVFAAFSRCEHLVHWWGPTGWSLPVCEMDFRPGGSWFYCMSGHDADGNPMQSCGRATFHHIDAPAEIVYTDTFVDRQGRLLPDTPVMEITVTFEQIGDRTRVTSATVFASRDELQTVIDMGMEQGIAQTWDRLEAHLADLA